MKRQHYNLYSKIILKSVEMNLMEKDKRLQERDKLLKMIIIDSPKEARLDATRCYMEEVEDALKALMGPRGVRVIDARLVSRGLVGLSEPFGLPVFEVGLSWDPLLQVPFIPGSTIKGTLRSIARDMGWEESRLKRVFGYVSPEEGKAHVGSFIFGDSYPIELNERGILLEPEVLTPIYRETIEESKAKPNPVPYISVARGVKFRFILASRYLEDVNEVERLLRKAFELGIGARTLIGYSIFQVVK